MGIKVTDERQAMRDQMEELSIVALDLAAERCELALEMAKIYKQQQALGQAMERLGGKELQIHQKRKQLAGLLLVAPVNDPAIQ